MVRAAVVLAIACGCSPYGSGSFMCESDPPCGADGVCSNGCCSFPDTGCESGLRFGERSGPLSGEVVTKLDAGIDGPPGEKGYGTGLVKACFASAPSGVKTFAANMTIDTNGTQCATLTNSNEWCVIAGQTIDISLGATVSASGARPL